MRSGEREARTKAKQLRRTMPKAEVILWRNLRLLRRHGYNFQRQHPIDPYIADFATHSGMLVIEIDGATHDRADEVQHDRRRDAYLRSRGWWVFRIQTSRCTKIFKVWLRRS